MRRETFWQDQRVIITGASSGIGRALAEALVARGARLGLISRRQTQLTELAESLNRGTGLLPAATATADVTRADEVQQAVAAIERELGPCDVLIASAGIHIPTPGPRFSPADANAVIATNVQGVINAIGAVLPGMVERRRGHVVAIASMAGLLGLPGVAAYSASKAAVITLMESLSIDLRRYGIRTTTICPGFVDTPLLKDHDRSKLKFLISAREAAERTLRAVEGGKAEAWFPWRMWAVARLGRALPKAIYRRLVSRWDDAPGDRESAASTAQGRP